MESDCIPFRQTGQFSDFFLDYIEGKKKLSPFYRTFPTLRNIAALAKERIFDPEKRKVLHGHLITQYEGLELDSQSASNIEKLTEENTFTVTTGHQLNLLTGPLYFIYKIVTAIDLAERLNALHDGNHYVPVYWMATEDHDLEEIDHVYLQGKTYKWETSQTGAVGRMKTENFKEFFSTLPFSSPDFEKHYLTQPNLAKATMSLVHELFQGSGLVILDADSRDLKKQFVPAMRRELCEGLSATTVRETDARLEALGYSPQIHVRDINLFYLTDNARERIVRNEDGTFSLADSERTLSEEQIFAELAEAPERFSPNVVLRPLYQEVVLPNLAYIGGPAEMVYWLQLQDMFEAFEVDFPVLMPRKFALLLNAKARRLMARLGLNLKDLFNKDKATLLDEWLERRDQGKPDLSKEIKAIAAEMGMIAQKAEETDASLREHVMARHNEIRKMLHHLENKLIKAERRKNEETHKQIKALFEIIRPGDVPQERKMNLLEVREALEHISTMLIQKESPQLVAINIP